MNVSKVVCEVSGWRFLIAQLRTPAKVDSDQIETLIENNQHYTMWEIANILKISKSIKLLVKMKNVSFILWKKLYGLFGQPNICTRSYSSGISPFTVVGFVAICPT